MLKDLLTQISRMRFKISSEARAKLWRRLSTLCQSDVPINKAVEFLSESETNGPATAFLKQQSIGLKHRNFAAAAAGWVPPEELLMIMITQEDRIDRGFTQAARIASTRAKLRGTLFASLTYPSLLAIFTAVVIAVLPGVALETMISISDPATWKPVSRSVLVFSKFVGSWGLVVALMMILTLITLIWSAPRWAGEMRRRLDWIPIYSVYRQIAGPEVLSAWLALMSAGTQSHLALTTLKAGMPAYLAWHITQMQNAMYQGQQIEVALNTGLFTKETLDDLRIFQRTGDFSAHGDDIAAADIDRALTRIESATKTLSSLMLLTVGGVAVWIYIGIARIAMVVQHQAF